MSLKHIKGDLITIAEEGFFDIIVHGCNCQNTMGSGVAEQIKKRYPLAWDADCKAAQMWGVPVARLGNFSYATVVSKKVNTHVFLIINAYTQLNYLPRGKDHFDYEAFQLLLRKFSAIDPDRKLRWGFPYIGMGLAGGDETRIIPMLHEFGKRYDATLVEYSDGPQD